MSSHSYSGAQGQADPGPPEGTCAPQTSFCQAKHTNLNVQHAPDLVPSVTLNKCYLERVIEFAEIDRDRCLEMLVAASGGVGRIAVSVSPPVIRPVNYAFDERTQSVVFRSALGSKLREGLSSGTAAFEIDGTDPVERAGWSVIIVGEAEEVTDPAEIDRLEGFELEPWAPGLRTHWVRIRATSASGRRIVDRDKWGLR